MAKNEAHIQTIIDRNGSNCTDINCDECPLGVYQTSDNKQKCISPKMSHLRKANDKAKYKKAQAQNYQKKKAVDIIKQSIW